MAASWFALGILAIPFNDFFGLLPLGEMQSELSAYIFLPLLALIVFQRLRSASGTTATLGAADSTYLVPNLALVFFLVIVISGCINLPDLLGDRYQGRYPIEKFVASAMVVGYGFALAYLSHHMVERYSIRDVIIRPVCLSIVVCAFFAALEIFSDWGSLAASIYGFSASITHLGQPFPGALSDSSAAWVLIGRARSVCFEPPALAAFAGAAWPWAYAGVATATKRHRPAYVLVLLLCSGLIVVAMSRTSAMLLFANLIVYLLLRFVYLPPALVDWRVPQIVSIILLIGAVAVAITVGSRIDGITATIANSDDVSNVTRYGLITSAINMFRSQPLWGFGFGQFGFHYEAYLPDWAFRSWEVREYVAGARGWPPSFALLARFAAETGLAGILTWIGIWLFLVRAIWRATLAYQRATGELLILSYPLIMAFVCALLAGVAVDSVRAPMMWVSMGAGCCYLRDVGHRLARIRGDSNLSRSGPRLPAFAYEPAPVRSIPLAGASLLPTFPRA